MGEVFIVISFLLLPECEKHPEVLAPDTIGKVILRPKKATLQRDTTFLYGVMSPLVTIKLGDDR